MADQPSKNEWTVRVSELKLVKHVLVEMQREYELHRGRGEVRDRAYLDGIDDACGVITRRLDTLQERIAKEGVDKNVAG